MTGQHPSGGIEEPVEGRIEPAVTAWARNTFAAPRRLHALVTGVEPRDEIVDRIATHVEQRTFRELRSPTGERRSTRPRVDPRTADPFAYTNANLKADSEHVAQCAGCAASGLMRCGDCHGTGNGRCPACHGSGKQTSAKTGRPIQCKSCRTTGTAPCRNCAGAGSVHCNVCLGSGHQLAWLTLEREERWEVSVPPASPLVLTHPMLREGRPVTRAELTTATVLAECAAEGPLDLRQLAAPDQRLVAAQLAQIDSRLERVRYQQYVKLAAIRRDVTFEMCGTRATLSLSGSRLLGATTPEVLRPIRRRLYLWLALCVLMAVCSGALGHSMLGASSYFQIARGNAALLAMVATICSIPALGVILRSWRGGRRFHRMRWPTAMWSGGAVIALVLILIVSAAARPDLGEASHALAANNTALARAVIDAYEELHGPTVAAKELEDQVLLAEAGHAQGPDRLKLLDAVAARKGSAASQAAGDASALRLDEVRQLIAAHRGAEALSMLDHAFPGDSAPPVAEERARAHEVLASACTTAACRLGESGLANTARTTPARVDAQSHARVGALDALDPKRIDARLLLPRLQQLRQLRDAGLETARVAASDAELQGHATAAVELANTKRGAVPLLGNELAIAEELVGPSTTSPAGVPSIALDGITVYLVLDRAGRCTGVYATGTTETKRALKSTTWPAVRVLAQAIGGPGSIPQPTAGGQARWNAAGMVAVARWGNGDLVELRIGDATP